MDSPVLCMSAYLPIGHTTYMDCISLFHVFYALGIDAYFDESTGRNNDNNDNSSNDNNNSSKQFISTLMLEHCYHVCIYIVLSPDTAVVVSVSVVVVIITLTTLILILLGVLIYFRKQ